MVENMTTPAVYRDNATDQSGSSSGGGEDALIRIMKSIHTMSVVIYSLVLVLGLVGNGVVIWATGFRMKRTVSTVWYLNLAVADLLVTAFLPLGITTRVLNGRWAFGWFICAMDIIVFYMNVHASIFILVVISVDRCVCMVCPVWTQNHRTVRKASWVSLGVWVLSLALSSPYVFFKDFGYLCWDYPDLPTVTTNFVVAFVVPFAAIVSCYSVIVYRLRNNRLLASQSGRSFKIIATVIAVFFLCWLPYHIIWLMYAVNLPVSKGSALDIVIRFGIPITYALALVNSCVNPLLYVFMGQGFKDVFRSRSVLKVLEKAFAEETPQTSSSSADPSVTRKMIDLSEIEGSTGPPGE